MSRMARHCPHSAKFICCFCSPIHLPVAKPKVIACQVHSRQTLSPEEQRPLSSTTFVHVDGSTWKAYEEDAVLQAVELSKTCVEVPFLVRNPFEWPRKQRLLFTIPTRRWQVRDLEDRLVDQHVVPYGSMLEPVYKISVEVQVSGLSDAMFILKKRASSTTSKLDGGVSKYGDKYATSTRDQSPMRSTASVASHSPKSSPAGTTASPHASPAKSRVRLSSAAHSSTGKRKDANLSVTVADGAESTPNISHPPAPPSPVSPTASARVLTKYVQAVSAKKMLKQEEEEHATHKDVRDTHAQSPEQRNLQIKLNRHMKKLVKFGVKIPETGEAISAEQISKLDEAHKRRAENTSKVSKS